MKKLVATILFATSIAGSASAMTYSQVKLMAKEVIQSRDFGLLDADIKDMKKFCPRYSNLSSDEKEDFFANLIATMARYESDLKPRTTFKENNGNVSAGLLQISYGSLYPIYKKNGCDDISVAEDLKNPRNNIECGLGIMSILVKKDGFLAKNATTGASRYWSVLRPPYTVYIKSLKKSVKLGKRDMIIKDIKKSFKSCAE